MAFVRNAQPPHAGLRGMAWGLAVVANVVATGLASGAYALAARAAQRRQRDLGRSTGPAAIFFAVVATFLLLASARQVAAAAGAHDLDVAIYLANVPVAALAIVPHAYLVALVRTGDPARAGQVGLFFTVAVATGAIFALVGGITEEPRTDYGTDYSIDSAVARALVAVIILLPGLAGSGWLVASSGRVPESERLRIRLVGWATLGYFVLFTVDAYGLSGPLLLADRVLTAGTGLLAAWAYRSPRPPAPQAYTPPPSPVEHHLFR